jgi:hypothetical protein
MTVRWLWLAVWVAIASGCNLPPAADVHIGRVGGVNVTSLAQPLIKRTKAMTIDWGPMGHAGQFAVAQVLTYGGGEETAIIAPSGWKLMRDDRGAPKLRQSLYWKIVQQADGSTNRWNFSERVDAQGAVLLLDDLPSTARVEAASGNTGSGNKPTAKSVVATMDGDLILAFYATNFGPGGLSVTPPRNAAIIVDQTWSQNEYWIAGTTIMRGRSDDIQSETVQLSDWIGALVAIARQTGVEAEVTPHAPVVAE